MNNWPVEFFNQRYLDMFMTRSAEQAKHDAAVIANITHAKPGQLIADFCCGAGDVLHELQQKGLRTYGVDIVPEYVHKAAPASPASRIAQGDALTHDFGRFFDITYNWYTSFGYFEHEQNQKLLSNMSRHLKPGGTALLETYNVYNVIRNFEEKKEYRLQWNGKDFFVQRVSDVDVKTRVLSQRWTFESEEDKQSYDTRTQLYLPDDIASLMRLAGLDGVEIYESPAINQTIEERPLQMNSARVLLVGRKQ